MKTMNEPAHAIKRQALLEEFDEILAFVQHAFQAGGTAHEVESGRWQRMLKLGRSVYQAWLDLFSDGDAGERVVLEDGREAGRGDPGVHGRRQGGRAARWRQESLCRAGWTYLPETLADVTEILDLLHALASLWEAAHLFHPNGSDAARAFVKEQARRLLHGEVAAVIHSLRWLGTHHKLKGKRRETLERVCGYFHNNAQRMAYDVYLEHGFPIASGVIEGACRCVVKDRMERSGMRWVMSGARAMLDMRCIYLSGLWEEFTAFRIQRESRRLDSGYAANDPDFSMPLA
ncbi:MAG: hypothetical protein P8Z33_14360, partial [Gammaproteobacteria bacterium]